MAVSLDDLVDEVVVAVASGLDDPKSVKRVLQTAVRSIARHLHKGDEVRITGLGVFGTKRRAPRKGRNPKTGESIDIPARDVIAFRPAADLKRLVEGDAQ